MAPGTVQQDALFSSRWLLTAPYVSDELSKGCWREPRSKAVTRRYVQLNSAKLVWCVVLDVDHDELDGLTIDAGLPEPSWTAVNPFNGHGHVAYILEVPIARSDAARTKPLRYLARIEAGLCAALRADVSYAGLLTKNPLSNAWNTFWCPDEDGGVYTLTDLAQALGDRLPRQLPRKPETSHGLGRNVTLFNALRTWAYTAIRRYREDGREEWEAMTLAWAQSINQGFPEPLPAREVRDTAHSVAKWVWTNFSEDQFRAIQQKRASKPRPSRRTRDTAAQRVLEADL